jgi:hypothetical protein
VAPWRDAGKASRGTTAAATAAATAATAATAAGTEAATAGESQPDVQRCGVLYAEYGPARSDL